MPQCSIPTMQQISERVIRDTWSAVWDEGQVDVLDQLTAPNYVRTNSVTHAQTPLSKLKAEIHQIRAGLPDLNTTVDAVIMGDGQIAVFWASEGTHTGMLLDVPATGVRVRTSGSNLMTIQDGLITSEQVTWDASELLACLGVRSLSARPAVDADRRFVATTVDADPAPELLKGFNRQFITGVTVVTTCDDGVPRGLAVNAYASISVEPPRVLVCVQKTSLTYSVLFKATHLGINILSADQTGTVASFAKSGHDKFAGVQWHSGPAGSPLLDGSSAALEAEICDRLQAETHTMFVCRVRHAEVGEGDPMIYRAGRFFHSNDLTQLE